MSTRDRQLSDRIHLVEHNEAAVHLLLGKLDVGADIVATIIDVRDEIGAELADHLGVAGEAERVAGPDRIPTIIATVDRSSAASAFARTHPRIGAGLSVRPPVGRVPVIIIASGGVTLVHVDRVPLPRAGQA